MRVYVVRVWSPRLRQLYPALQKTVRKYVYKAFISCYWLSAPIRTAQIWLLFYPPTFQHSPHHRFFFYHGVWPTRSPSSILLNSLPASSSSVPGANLWHPLKQHISSRSRLYHGPSFSETSPIIWRVPSIPTTQPAQSRIFTCKTVRSATLLYKQFLPKLGYLSHCNTVGRVCLLLLISVCNWRIKNQLDAIYYFIVLLTSNIQQNKNETTNVVINITVASSWWWA